MPQKLKMKQGEREKGMAGMSPEQLARMRHINSFLEHNLRENGEMLASLGKLQEEKQEMKAMNWTLKERLADCVCSTTEERGKTLYGRYLRAESFRKALVWQKRYLVVLLTGEAGEGEKEPVLAIQRPRNLPKQGRWRSVVHVIIAVSRMKFLVRRWRSGKRAGARLASASPLPSPSTSLRGGSVPALPSPLHRPTLGRSHSMRSTSRPSTLGIRANSQHPEERGQSSLSMSSPSSSQQRPLSSLASGMTPPTRDREQRRSVGNAPIVSGEVRRSLGLQFGADHTIAGVQVDLSFCSLYNYISSHFFPGSRLKKRIGGVHKALWESSGKDGQQALELIFKTALFPPDIINMQSSK